MKKNVLGMIEGKTLKIWVWVVAVAAAVSTLLAAGDNSTLLLLMVVFLVVVVDLEEAFPVDLNSIFDLFLYVHKPEKEPSAKSIFRSGNDQND